jgi:hypothetical protein
MVRGWSPTRRPVTPRVSLAPDVAHTRECERFGVLRDESPRLWLRTSGAAGAPTGHREKALLPTEEGNNAPFIADMPPPTRVTAGRSGGCAPGQRATASGARWRSPEERWCRPRIRRSSQPFCLPVGPLLRASRRWGRSVQMPLGCVEWLALRPAAGSGGLRRQARDELAQRRARLLGRVCGSGAGQLCGAQLAIARATDPMGCSPWGLMGVA